MWHRVFAKIIYQSDAKISLTSKNSFHYDFIFFFLNIFRNSIVTYSSFDAIFTETPLFLLFKLVIDTLIPITDVNTLPQQFFFTLNALVLLVG